VAFPVHAHILPAVTERGWLAVFAGGVAIAGVALGCSAVLGIGDLPGEAADAADGEQRFADAAMETRDDEARGEAAPSDARPDGDGGKDETSADGDAADVSGDTPSDTSSVDEAPSVSPPVVIGVTQGTTSAVGITPAGAAAGDLLFFALGAYGENTVTLTPPTSGGAFATLLERVDHPSGGNDAIVSAVYVLPIVGPPDPTYTFTTSGGNGNALDVITLCVRGGSAADSSAGAPTGNDGTSDTPTGASLSTSQPNELLVWYWYGDDHALTAPPGGWTSQVSGSAAPNNLSGGYYGEYSEVAAPAGVTGDVPATASGVDDWAVILFAVEPAGP
jgi:hypothetical protein